ncbi:MAG: hypothetical protein HUU47_09570 [Bacteroidetes bacterium]|nr:hypothetical protein [Bacteroidota bacterium]
MNLLAHYYFSSKQGKHWYNAGLLFPDLLKIFKSKIHLSKIEKTNFENSEITDLKYGIASHKAVDKVFHNWQWFLSKNHEILNKLRKSKLNFERDWVLSHIFIEMAIDCYLSAHYSQVVEELYNDFEKCNNGIWKILFDKCEIDDFNRWESGLGNFLKIKYIYKYKDTSAIIYSLNRIYESTGIGKFDEKQNDYLLLLLIEILPEINYKISELKKIIE